MKLNVPTTANQKSELFIRDGFPFSVFSLLSCMLETKYKSEQLRRVTIINTNHMIKTLCVSMHKSEQLRRVAIIKTNHMAKTLCVSMLSQLITFPAHSQQLLI
jgi:hypothetical protein